MNIYIEEKRSKTKAIFMKKQEVIDELSLTSCYTDSHQIKMDHLLQIMRYCLDRKYMRIRLHEREDFYYRMHAKRLRGDISISIKPHYIEFKTLEKQFFSFTTICHSKRENEKKKNQRPKQIHKKNSAFHAWVDGSVQIFQRKAFISGILRGYNNEQLFIFKKEVPFTTNIQMVELLALEEMLNEISLRKLQRVFIFTDASANTQYINSEKKLKLKNKEKAKKIRHIRALMSSIKGCRIIWVKREKNKEAHQLFKKA